MDERVIRDGAGDLWFVEPAGRAGTRGQPLRCRHELGYEVLVEVPEGRAPVEEGALVDALERERRRVPAAVAPEAA